MERKRTERLNPWKQNYQFTFFKLLGQPEDSVIRKELHCITKGKGKIQSNAKWGKRKEILSKTV
jgi:hypothetical protein